MWYLLLNYISLVSNLAHKCINIYSTLCLFYDVGIDEVEHIYFDCDFAKHFLELNLLMEQYFTEGPNY